MCLDRKKWNPIQWDTGTLPIQSNVIQQPLNPNDNNNRPPLPVLAPLEDGDTDATSSQIASSDLPSSQTDNDIIENKNTFNAEAAEFVPNVNVNANANVMLLQLIGLQNICLPPLSQRRHKHADERGRFAAQSARNREQISRRDELFGSYDDGLRHRHHHHNDKQPKIWKKCEKMKKKMVVLDHHKLNEKKRKKFRKMKEKIGGDQPPRIE